MSELTLLKIVQMPGGHRFPLVQPQASAMGGQHRQLRLRLQTYVEVQYHLAAIGWTIVVLRILGLSLAGIVWLPLV